MRTQTYRHVGCFGHVVYPLILLLHIGGHLTPPGWIDRYGFALLFEYVFEAFCNITEIYKSPSEQIHISRFDRWFWASVIELGSSILVVLSIWI